MSGPSNRVDNVSWLSLERRNLRSEKDDARDLSRGGSACLPRLEAKFCFKPERENSKSCKLWFGDSGNTL
jgi:hypothetical protein